MDTIVKEGIVPIESSLQVLKGATQLEDEMHGPFPRSFILDAIMWSMLNGRPSVKKEGIFFRARWWWRSWLSTHWPQLLGAKHTSQLQEWYALLCTYYYPMYVANFQLVVWPRPSFGLFYISLHINTLMYNWTSHEEHVINNIESRNICDWLSLADKLWFILETLPHLFPQDKANKETSFWGQDETISWVTSSVWIYDDFAN